MSLLTRQFRSRNLLFKWNSTIRIHRIVDIIRSSLAGISNRKSSPLRFHPLFYSKERKKHGCPSFSSSSLVFNRGRIDAYRHDSHEYLLYDSCNFWTMNLRGHGRVAFNWRTLIPICGVYPFSSFHRFRYVSRRNGGRKDGKFEDIRFGYTSRFNISRYFETYTRGNKRANV